MNAPKRNHPQGDRTRWLPLLWAAVWLAGTCGAVADATNEAVAPRMAPLLPDAGVSLIRVVGALALVLGIFLGGVWLYRNWQRLALQRGRAPKLNVVETRSLGGRHALYIVGYEQERFLIASSPNGVSLLTHLPAAEPALDAGPAPESGQNAAPVPPFAQTLARMLKGK